MPEWAAIVIAFVSVFTASLTFAVALGRSARRADEAVESSPELTEIATSLRPLSAERSPSGRRFFPTPEARSQLAALVYDVLNTRAA
jgi:hypothetical protein